MASTGAAEAPTPGVGHDLAANAALQYWQAFALLPALDTMQEKRLADWSKDPLDAAALKLIAASEESRRYLLRGDLNGETPEWSDSPGAHGGGASTGRQIATLGHFRHSRWSEGIDNGRPSGHETRSTLTFHEGVLA